MIWRTLILPAYHQAVQHNDWFRFSITIWKPNMGQLLLFPISHKPDTSNTKIQSSTVPSSVTNSPCSSPTRTPARTCTTWWSQRDRENQQWPLQTQLPAHNPQKITYLLNIPPTILIGTQNHYFGPLLRKRSRAWLISLSVFSRSYSPLPPRNERVLLSPFPMRLVPKAPLL